MFIFFGKLFLLRPPGSEAKDFVLQSVKKSNNDNTSKMSKKKG
ncbi:hypothetical protein BRDCF_p2131 [Bacteroidales bacterium CF]|nr:hypothetical protein BRDCF_p2131 [Bacteroidales bacterium CF]